jgi:hypothetical protein
MSETRAGGAGIDDRRNAIDAPASSEAVIPMPPAATILTDADTGLRVERLSKEVGWMLIAAGVVGFVVPGILGTPFLLAGAFVVVPGGPKLLSRWAGRNPPKFVNSGMRQIGRFLDDLERRYPRK